MINSLNLPKTPIGWLSPEGKFYECKFYKHLDTAIKIVSNLVTILPEDPVLWLEKHGWLHMQEFAECYIYSQLNSLEGISPAQLNTLFDLIVDSNYESEYMKRIRMLD